jgi:hypothetical protein
MRLTPRGRPSWRRRTPCAASYSAAVGSGHHGSIDVPLLKLKSWDVSVLGSYRAIKFSKILRMEEHVFAFLLVMEDTTEKVLQFLMTLKSICSKKMFILMCKNVFLHFCKPKTKNTLFLNHFSF